MAAQSVGLFFNETSGERRVVSELYPLPVNATFSGSITVGNVEGDAAHDAADVGDPIKVGFKAESTTPAAVADGDRSNLAGTLFGAAFVNLRDVATGAETGVAANPLVVGGAVAHDAADSGNPVKVGGKAYTGVPTAVADGDRVNLWLDEFGRARVVVSDGPSVVLRGTVDDVSPATYSEGGQSVLRSNPIGDLHANLRSQDGSEVGVTANPLIVKTDALGPGSTMFVVSDVNDTSPLTIGDGSAFQLRMTAQRALHTQAAWQSRSDVFTTTSSGTTVSAVSSPKRFFSIQVTQTGGVTVWDVRVEGSNDGTNFTTIATHTNADTSGATVFAVDKPVLYFRSRCAGISGGTNLTAVILGVA